MDKFTRSKQVALFAGVAMWVPGCPLANAQDVAATEQSQSGEIIVTAQKRGERLLDVPVPVTAIQSDDLRKQNLVKITDFATRIPGVSISGNNIRAISIRGVNTGGATNPTTAITIDDVPVGSSGRLSLPFPDIDPSELSRIEVLRGPQGTLYGAASLGGLIKLVTLDPDSTKWSGRAEVGGSTISNGDEGWSLRGAINVPILKDRLALRVSGFHREDPAFMDNINPLVNEKDTNKSVTEGGRAALWFNPVDPLTINLSYLRQTVKTDNNAPTRVTPFPTDYKPVLGYFVSDVGPAVTKTKLELYQARINYDLGPATLTSVSAWSRFNSATSSDLTTTFPYVFNSVIPGFPAILPGSPAGSSVRLNDGSQLRKFSEELRLASNGNDQVQYLVGLFYTKERSVADQNLQAFDPSGSLLSELAHFPLPGSFEEKAVFADITYRFTEQFDLQVGGRYSKNQQTFQQNQVILTNTVANALFGVTGNGVVQTSEDDAFTWLVTPRYRFNEDMMVYARVASGYRPGGPNNNVPGAPKTFGSDTVVNYELGFKGRLLDRKFTVDASLFDIEWKDIQLQNTSPSNILFLTNGGKARSRGAEASVQFTPGSGWTISANSTYTDAELTENLPGPALAGGSALLGTKGMSLPFVPKFASNLGVEKSLPLGSGIELTLGANWNHVGKRNSPLRSSTAPMARRNSLFAPAYDVVDLRANLSYGPWDLSFYVRNLGSERGVLSVDDRQGAVTTTNVTFINPQTIGALLAFRF
ncbi:TonB-dependent receptor [Sphingobium sp. AP50]|uniref:TonB-dependent receptor n=1 Tax=Sphingobium sp. AP50 TaxID=1884369 RepID=UPI0015A58D3B|nr:TonB-dependent receptor [Sphingobium sp. AP50]